MAQHDRRPPAQRVAPPRHRHRRPQPQPVPDRQPALTEKVGLGGWVGARLPAWSPGREPVGEQDDAGAFAGPEGPAGQPDPGHGQHHPGAAVAGAAGLLGHGGGDLDARRLPGPADEDAAADRRRPHRRRGRSRGQQGAQHQRTDGGAAGALLPETERAARAQAGHRQAAGDGDPGRRTRAPGTEEDPGRGGRGQRHAVRVGVDVATNHRTATAEQRPTTAGRGDLAAGLGGRQAAVTRSLSCSKRRWPMPGTSRSSSTVVKGWAER